MQIRFQQSPKETKLMNTDELRDNYLISSVCQEDRLSLVYTHYDRVVIGGCKPITKKLNLSVPDEFRADYFLERREMGIINIAGNAIIKADGNEYSLNRLDCLYLGRGVKKITFSSKDKKNPAILYFLSAPAHSTYPSRLMKSKNATPLKLGKRATADERIVYKYIHNEGIKSCQLVMGITLLKYGSVWNSVPPHTHTRRMEAYFYFDVDESQRVFHFMGQTQETRHLVVANHEAVISPPWSMHFGVGTASYGFIWGMAGENKEFTDMDLALINTLK